MSFLCLQEKFCLFRDLSLVQFYCYVYQQMHSSPKLHKNRLGISCILSAAGWIIGMIAIFISLTLALFKNWPSLASKTGCPSSWGFTFMGRIPIIQIIYLVSLALLTACLLIIAAVLLKHKSNIVKYWHLSHHFRVAYPILLSVGLIGGVVSLILAIKMYVGVAQVNDHFNNGQIPQTCLTATQVTNLVNKTTPLVIILVLICLMIFFAIFLFICLPYRYCTLKPREQNYRPIQEARKKVQEVKMPNRLEISQQELLTVPVVSTKAYQSIGIGDEQAIVKVQKAVEKQFSSIAVGDNSVFLPAVQKVKSIQKIQKVDAAVNSIRVDLKSSKVGNHVQFSEKQTDCEGLVEPIIYRNQSIQAQNFVEVREAQEEIATQKEQEQPTEKAVLTPMTNSRFKRNLERTETRHVDPTLLTPRRGPKVEQIMVQNQYEAQQHDGYYYLSSARAQNQVIQEPRSTRKLQNINDSARKLIQDPLRASRGPNGVDWSHYNILWAGQRINRIYTPPKPTQEQISTSNHKYKGQSKKWWPAKKTRKRQGI